MEHVDKVVNPEISTMFRWKSEIIEGYCTLDEGREENNMRI